MKKKKPTRWLHSLTHGSKELKAHVKAGAKLLDKYDKNWFKKITLKYLDMDSIDNCILGQLFKNKKGSEVTQSGFAFAINNSELLFGINFNDMYEDTTFGCKLSLLGKYGFNIEIADSLHDMHDGEAVADYSDRMDELNLAIEEAYAFITEQWAQEVRKRKAKLAKG